MSTASRHLATAPKRRVRQSPANFSNTLPVATPLSRTALFRADTHASPRVILNLPQARHTPPRRLVMPTAAGRRRFHWRPFPASRIPAPTPKRRMRQPTANFSNTLPATPLRGQLFSAQTYAPRHGTPLKPPWPRQGIPSPHIRGRSPAPLAKNAPTAKRGRRPAERYFRDRRLIVRLV